MTSPDPAKFDEESRAFLLTTLRARFAKNSGNVQISAQEAKLLGEALNCLEEKEAQTFLNPTSTKRKPFFLSLATILGAAGSFGLLATAFWQTSLTPALVASAIGLVAGIAAVKLDPSYRGHWLHDVD